MGEVSDVRLQIFLGNTISQQISLSSSFYRLSVLASRDPGTLGAVVAL